MPLRTLGKTGLMPLVHMIKTIIFDLGRVIVPFDLSRSYTALEKLGRTAAADIPERLRQSNLVQEFESGRIDPAEFVRRISDHLELTVELPQFAEIWSSIFLPHTLIPDDFVERLHQQYRLLLLSNTNALHFEMIAANYPILRHIDHFVLSYRVGAMKPDPKIYREAIAHAGCPASECFFTDDIPAYVEAARAEGMQAVQFVGFEQLAEELQGRGVRW